MKQIGNLAIVCATRPDVSFQLHDSRVAVHVGQGPQRAVMAAAWDDDQSINEMIRELNFGAYTPQALAETALPEEGKAQTIPPERLSELLDLLIDDLIEEEGEHAVPVLKRLASIGFTHGELLALRFPSTDVAALANGCSTERNRC